MNTFALENMFFWTFYQKNPESATIFNIMIRNDFWAANQHSIIIYEGLCDNKDCKMAAEVM